MKTAVQEVVGMDVVRLVVGHVLALVGVAALAVVAEPVAEVARVAVEPVPGIVLDIVVVHALVAALAVVAAAAHLDVQVVRADVQIPASMAVNGALHKF